MKDDDESDELKNHRALGDVFGHVPECPMHPDHPSSMRKGPARVTSAAYRAGFDRIFGTPPVVGSA